MPELGESHPQSLSGWPWAPCSVSLFPPLSEGTTHRMLAGPLASTEPWGNCLLCLVCVRVTVEDSTLLPFKKGDLLILTKKQGLLASENWTLAQNDRTEKTGLVPTSCLYAIPTVTKPSAQLLVTHVFTCPQPGTPGRLGKRLRCQAWGPSSGARAPLPRKPGHHVSPASPATPLGEAGSACAVCGWGVTWHSAGAQSVCIPPSLPPGSVLGVNLSCLNVI